MVHRILLATMLVALVGTIALTPKPVGAAPPPETYSAVVFATSPDWLNTSISLEAGDSIHISSDPNDTWCWGVPLDCTNANGTPDRPNDEERPTTLFPDGHFGQIYARIGNQIIPGGVDFTATATESGVLELIMNERIATHGDNAGSITFSIIVQRSNSGSAELPPNASYLQDLAELWKLINQVVQTTNRVCQHLDCGKLSKPVRVVDQSLTIGNLIAAIPLSLQLGDDLKAMNEALETYGKDSPEFCLAGQTTYATARSLHETLAGLVLGLELIFPVPPADSGPTCA